MVPIVAEQTAPRRPRSRKPAVAQQEVLARTLAGQSKSQIAHEMDIDRQTVTRIQEGHNLPQLLEESRKYVVERVVPDAIESVHAQIKNRKAPGDGDLAARILEGTGVLGDEAKPVFNFQADVRFQMLSALGPPPRPDWIAAHPEWLAAHPEYVPPAPEPEPPQVESVPPEPEPPAAPSNGSGGAARPCEPKNIVTGRHDQWCHCRDCRPDLYA